MKRFNRVKDSIKESFGMAIDAIRQNKLRSILTLLGISIGVFSVIGVMTAIRTLESSIASGLNVFAANTFVIQKNPEFDFGQRDRKYRNRKNITIDQYKTLKDRANIPLLVSPVTGMSVRDVQYRGKKIKNSVELFGGDEGTIRFYNTFLADGRNFIDDDIHYSRNVCVLGMDVVDQLFPFEDPLGKRIKINGLEYFVIGITERQGEAFGTSKDNYIGIPITTYLEKYSSKWTSLRIHIESPSDQLYEKTMNEVIGHLRSIRKVQPKMDNDFEIVTNTGMIEQFSGYTKGIKFFFIM